MATRNILERRVTPVVALRSTLFAVGQVISTAVFAVVAVCLAPLPYRARYTVISQWTHLNLWWLRVTCGLKHEAEGLENIPATPCIVFCKHQSAWETLNLQRYFKPQVWVLKRELLRIPMFGWGLALLNPIAIDRKAGKAAIDQVVEQGRDRLTRRIWVVIFPEGTRVPPGKRRRYRLGGAVLAEKTGYPVLPVAHNAGDYWPRHSFIKYPGTISMVVGPLIESHGRTAAEINALAEDWIESTVERLRAPYSRPTEAVASSTATPDAEAEESPSRT